MLKRLLFIPLLLVALAAGLALNRQGFNRIEDLRKIERIPSSTIAALIPGEANVSGTAQILAGKQLQGPDSRAVCLYYKYTIEKKTTDSDGQTKWETTHSEKRFVPFTLKDDTGTITVYPADHGTVSLAKKHSRTSGDLRYTEYRLDPGMTVFTMGMAQRDKTGLSLGFDAPGTYIPILSVKTEAEERGSVGLFSLLLTVGGLVFISLSIFFLTRLLAIHQTLAYLCMVAMAIILSLLVQSNKMIRNDLHSAYTRLQNEREVRQQEISGLISGTGISWDGHWSSLETIISKPHSALSAAAKNSLTTHRVNMARSIRRTEQIRHGFPESWIASSMGYGKPEAFALSAEEQAMLSEMEAKFIPSRISWLATAIMSGIGLLGAVILGGIGIRSIKTKRWIENIPTVKTRGAVYGINEINGTAVLPEGAEPLTGPLSSQPCVAYHYIVREKRRSGKKTTWVTITNEKCQVPFLCRDQEGSIPVLPDDSELMFKTRSKQRRGNLEYTEHRIPVDSEIYVLGSAVINPETHDSLVIAKGEDRKMPFIISNYAESDIIASKASTGFLLVNFGFNFFMLAGFSLAGFKGGFGAVAYMTAALTPVIYLLLFMIAVLYNDLIFLLRRCDSMWANIDVALKKRFDLLPQLVDTVKGYLQHEKSLQSEMAAIRSTGASINPDQAVNMVSSENAALTQIIGLIENYPDLKGNELMTSLMERMRDLEDEVALMREGYNHATEIYNTRIAKFPEVLLARSFKMNPRNFFNPES